MITRLSSAAAGKAASAAAPASAVRRLIMKAMVKTPFRCSPNAYSLNTCPAGARQAHVDVDLRAEVGNEFHRAGQVVVESQRLRPDLQPLRPQRQRRPA